MFTNSAANWLYTFVEARTSIRRINQLSSAPRVANFSEDAARSVIAAFRQTVALVNGSGADELIEDAEIGSGTVKGNGVKHSQDSPKYPPNLAGTSSAAPKQPGAFMEYTWQLSGEAVATLTVSRRLDEDDVETLAEFFAIAKRTLLKAAKQGAEANKQTGQMSNGTEA